MLHNFVYTCLEPASVRNFWIDTSTEILVEVLFVLTTRGILGLGIFSDIRRIKESSTLYTRSL